MADIIVFSLAAIGTVALAIGILWGALDNEK